VTAVAAPSASVMPLPSAAPAASSGRGVTETADASPHDDPFDRHFDRHFDRAVRDDRPSRDDRVVARGIDDAGRQRTSEPGTDTETSGRASDREIDPRDDARHPGDPAPVVGVAALLLAVRAEAPVPTEPDTVPATGTAVTGTAVTGTAVTGTAVTGTAVTGTGTSTSMIDVTPADADPTPTPVPSSVMVDGTATDGPSGPESSGPVPSAAPPASASDPLSGVEITVDASATPSTSAIGIETLGRAALRARVADSATDGAATATATATAASTGAGPSALVAVVADAGPAAETAATESAAPTPTPGAESSSRRVSFAEAAQEADPAPLSEPTTSSKPEVRAPLSLPSISVDLSDEGLGPMQLQARQGPDGLHLTLMAADREVGAALARAGAELRRDLESAGTTVGSLQVGQGSGDIGQGSGDRAGQRQGRADDGGLRGAPSLGGVTASTTAQPPLITTTRTSSADAGLDLLI
jgi:hypothetical protein